MTDAQQAQAIADQRARSRRLKAKAPASPVLDMGYTDEETQRLIDWYDSLDEYSLEEYLNQKTEWN